MENKEIERLLRLNDKLEKIIEKEDETTLPSLGVYEQIRKNALAINEITKANNPLTEKILQQIDTYLGEKY